MTASINRLGAGPSQTPVRASRRAADTRGARAARRSPIARSLLVALVSLAMLSAPVTALAADRDGQNKAGEVSRESGLGAAAAVSSLVYGPVKLLYATGGLVVGAFAWAFTAGDNAVAGKVFTRSLRGTYVITPEILLGQERLEFIGRDVAEPTTAYPETVASASDAASQGWVSAPSSSVESEEYDEMGW